MSDRLGLRIEDALLLAGIAPVWLPALGYRGGWVWLVLGADVLMLCVITWRRLRRLYRLREESETLPAIQPPERLDR